VCSVPLQKISTKAGSAALATHSSATARKLGLGLSLSLFVAVLIVAGVVLYRRRSTARYDSHGNPRLLALRRNYFHKRKSSGMPPPASVGSSNEALKLDFMPPSMAVRARREPGWKNLEDYEYD